MVKQIIWNKRADKIFDDIATYLHDNGSMKTATQFADDVYKQIDTLVRQPKIGRVSPIRPSVRVLNIDNYRLLCYRIQGTTIHIVDIWDTRQDPKKRKY
jgi:plasmid stabilization system protein ParE